MTPKKPGAKSPRSVPATESGPGPGSFTTSKSGRRPWKKKSVAEHILSQLDKLREEVAEKERDYLQAKKQLDQLESLREVLENQ